MEEAKKSFVPRKAVVEILKYAKEQGKKVCLVEDLPDYRLPDVIWKYILQEYGIDSYDDIVCSGTYWLHKEEGLYREVIKKYGKNLNYLHIGDKLDEDVIIPRYCGMDTFWIKGPRDLFNSIDSIQLEQLEKPNVRDLFERYV
jgi:FMN phosphatase YigB (HAD superfamily)